MRSSEAAAADPHRPEAYPRRVLLVLLGETPQVATETLYALAVLGQPPFVPSELHLATTLVGAHRAGTRLWLELERLRHDYRLPPISCVAATHMHLLGAPEPCEDIRSRADSLRAADDLLALVRRLADDGAGPPSALHASLAGGRKTLGYYLGQAMALCARPQDRLSHVLVAPDYEGAADFYYPTPDECRIWCPAVGAERDAAKATVELVDLPFVRLRQGLRPKDPLLGGGTSFAASVAAAERALRPARLEIGPDQAVIRCGGVAVTLEPAKRAWYLWFARRAAAGEPPVDPDRFWIGPPRDQKALQRPLCGVDVGAVVKLHAGPNPEGSRSEKLHETLYGHLKRGTWRAYFDPLRADIERALLQGLHSNEEAGRYAITGRPHADGTGKEYALWLAPEEIVWEEKA